MVQMKERKAEDTWRNEQRLIHGLRAHDPLILEALLQQYSRELFYLARLSLVGTDSAQDAEECLNDLFLIAWQEIDAFFSQGAFIVVLAQATAVCPETRNFINF